MPTGFIDRYCSALALALCAAATPAWALDVVLVGTFGDQAAVIAVDGGEPKTLRPGQKFGGVTVISVERERVTVEVEGKRRTLQRGQTYSTKGSADDRQSAVLAADGRGHFHADGAINGGAMRFILDTGATAIAIPAADAVRLGIDYRKGARGTIHTANGPAPAYRVKLDTVTLGAITLYGVDATVGEGGGSVALLGMSFLNRTEMRREGQNLTLTKRY